MTTFKRLHASQDWRAPMPPLHWRPVLDHVAEGFEPSRHPGKVLAIVSCRNGHSCAIRVGLGSNFTISAAGIVQHASAPSTRRRISSRLTAPVASKA